MRWIRLLFRIFGWLLTPLLAWAASFFGAVAGALIAMRIADPVPGLIVTAICGGLAGFLAIIGWLRYLRRSPELREVLAVTEDGTPDTTELDLSIVVVVLMGSLALAPRADAQTLSGSLGRFYEDDGWTSYRAGFITHDRGILGLQVHGDLFERVGEGSGGFAGIGMDATLSRTRKEGPYAIAGIGAGFGSDSTTDYSDPWLSWSVGAGYQVFPLSFLSANLESRWREMTLGKRDGLELAVGLGLHFGGNREPRTPAPRRPGPEGRDREPAIPMPEPPAPLTPGRTPVAAADSIGRPARRDPSTAPLTLIDSIVATATDAMGRPYQYGGTGADSSGFDCSGLIQYAYGEHGIALPRRSTDQAREGRALKKAVTDLRPGDLLTFSNSRRGTVTHVGLYLGNGRFIHSATRGVQVSTLSDSDPYGRWWYKRWVGARRIIG